MNLTDIKSCRHRWEQTESFAGYVPCLSLYFGVMIHCARLFYGINKTVGLMVGDYTVYGIITRSQIFGGLRSGMGMVGVSDVNLE